MPRLLRAALVILASVTVTRAAGANMAAVHRSPSRVLGPRLARETAMTVDDERLSFVCAEEKGIPACAFEARYTLRNPARAREDIAVAFYGVGTRGVAVKVDGVNATGTPSKEDLEALDVAVDELQREPGAPERPAARRADGPRVDRVGFTLVAEPGTRHEIVVTGTAVGGERFVPHGYGNSAVEARHVLFGTRRSPKIYDLEYLLAPIRTWKGEPKIDVRITYPSGWRIAISGEAAPGWSRGREGANTVLARSMTAKDAAALEMEIEPPITAFRNGGPLIGIGGTTGDFKGVRGRIGYEVAAPDWLLYSATVDTDFRKRFIVTPMIEAASPAFLILPSFGLGVGAPIQVAPVKRVGARIQGDLHLYPVGFVTSVDIYPRFGASGGFTEVSLLAQIGL